MGIVECWCGFTSISERLSTCFGLLLTERQKQETKHSFFVSFIRPSVCTCLKLPSGQRHSWIVPVWIGWMHNETEQLCTTYHSCPWFFNILLGDDLGVSGNTPQKINSQLNSCCFTHTNLVLSHVARLCPPWQRGFVGLIRWNLYNDFFRDADAYITPIYVVIWRAPLNCRVHRDQFFLCCMRCWFDHL